jgi:dynein heavy chain
MQTFMMTNVPELKYPQFNTNTLDTVFEYFVNENGQWAHWNDRVPSYEYPSDSTPEYSSIIIPTVDNGSF